MAISPTSQPNNKPIYVSENFKNEKKFYDEKIEERVGQVVVEELLPSILINELIKSQKTKLIASIVEEFSKTKPNLIQKCANWMFGNLDAQNAEIIRSKEFQQKMLTLSSIEDALQELKLEEKLSRQVEEEIQNLKDSIFSVSKEKIQRLISTDPDWSERSRGLQEPYLLIPEESDYSNEPNGISEAQFLVEKETALSLIEDSDALTKKIIAARPTHLVHLELLEFSSRFAQWSAFCFEKASKYIGNGEITDGVIPGLEEAPKEVGEAWTISRVKEHLEEMKTHLHSVQPKDLMEITKLCFLSMGKGFQIQAKSLMLEHVLPILKENPGVFKGGLTLLEKFPSCFDRQTLISIVDHMQLPENQKTLFLSNIMVKTITQ